MPPVKPQSSRRRLGSDGGNKSKRELTEISVLVPQSSHVSFSPQVFLGVLPAWRQTGSVGVLGPRPSMTP